MASVTMATEGDDWCVEGSDDEKYDPTHSGMWMPRPEDIMQMFDLLGKQKVLDLKWKCPGRRPPESENPPQEEEMPQEVSAEMEASAAKEEVKPYQPTEFDFDEEEVVTQQVTPRRTPGSKTPKSQKKVAKMDKILQDFMLQRKQDSAEKEAKRRLQRSPRTPLSGARMRYGSPGASPSVSKPSPSASTAPIRPLFSEGNQSAPPVRNLLGLSAPASTASVTGTTSVSDQKTVAGFDQKSTASTDVSETLNKPASDPYAMDEDDGS